MYYLSFGVIYQIKIYHFYSDHSTSLASLFSREPVQLQCVIFFLVPWEKVGARKRTATESKHLAEHRVESQNRWTSTYCQGERQWNLGA